MAELDTGRVRFNSIPGRDRYFQKLEQTIRNVGVSWEGLAAILGVSKRTLFDWRRGKYLMPSRVAKKINDLYDLCLPKHVIEPKRWFSKNATRLGYRAVIEKYGRIPVSEDARKRGWDEWWNETGRFITTSPIGKTKKVTLPIKSARLAEWVGIVIGDGGITNYQITITLNSNEEKEYQKFVVSLSEELFGIKPTIHQSKFAKAVDIQISRKELVRYCCEELGLCVGNKIKQGLCIPLWIVSGSSEFKKSCLRGLFDTDGCVIIHRYEIRGKLYRYKKLSFTSASPKLINDVSALLCELGIKSRVARGGRDVFIDSKTMVEKYFQVVDTNNSKNMERYHS